MKVNEGVHRALFHIRAWFIKKHLRKISGYNNRHVQKLRACLAKRISLKKRVQCSFITFRRNKSKIKIT